MSRDDDAAVRTLSPDEATFIENFRQLSPENQRYIRRLMFRYMQHKGAAPWRGSIDSTRDDR